MSGALVVTDLSRHYRQRGTGRHGRPIKAVDGVSFSVPGGSTLGIVGESGCGKSTTAKLILGLMPPTTGSVTFDGTPITARIDAAWRQMRRRIQMIYQDPLAALDRRMTAGEQIVEPLLIHSPDLSAQDRDARAAEVMDQVGLSAHHVCRFPHELSGGQRQRVIIARALILRPDLLVCDEPVSALDVSVQAQVLNLFEDLRAANGFTAVFISHDLKVVRQVSDRVAVMYLGRIVESGTPEEVFLAPLHPYAKALVSANLDPRRRGQRRIILQGDPPSPAEAPSGCPFHPRCAEALPVCAQVVPRLLPEGAREVACHRIHPAQATTEVSA